MIACGCEVCTSPDEKDKRLRSSILVKSRETTLVVDTTPDFRTQMLREQVKKLDAVIFTHPHKDHIAGLDDIRAFNYFQQSPVKVYANELTIQALKREFLYAFSDKKYPGLPEIDLHPIDQEPFMVGDLPVIPITVYHLRMPVLGFRFGKFTYITDANHIEPGEKKKIAGSDTLVINALRKEPHVSHYTLPEAVALAEELRIPHVYFTHISHQLGTHAAVSAELKNGMQLAYDGLTLRF